VGVAATGGTLKSGESTLVQLPGLRRRAMLGWALEGATLGGLVAMVALSAIITKEVQYRGTGGGLTALAAIDAPDVPAPEVKVEPASFEDVTTRSRDLLAIAETGELTLEEAPASVAAPIMGDAGVAAAIPEGMEDNLQIRWFGGRAVRPARTIWMTVTAYSPDERSCPGTADGITASLHSVFANGMKLVAADSRVLPLGSMITVPGYHPDGDGGDRIVPVLDRGGKIKGNRLDVLFPTHEAALKWGVRRVKVVVWEYADGQGKEDWRKIRDSK
jgi:3D (Asp-Asp-Asp) domain-containing protein